MTKPFRAKENRQISTVEITGEKHFSRKKEADDFIESSLDRGFACLRLEVANGYKVIVLIAL